DNLMDGSALTCNYRTTMGLNSDSTSHIRPRRRTSEMAWLRRGRCVASFFTCSMFM
ncbi:hypothetical protein JYU34_002198, partial [Plutella xylostella]